jgi:hypothetical protein
MSGDESFLARWSRRKRGAALETHARPEPAATERGAEPVPPDQAPPPIDPATLPPLESIGAGSDIRAFLAVGVPADLTRAALRRAWSADPTIRDFVGLSENSWDFTAAGGVPGFGSVTEDEVRRLLERLAGDPETADAIAKTEPDAPIAEPSAAVPASAHDPSATDPAGGDARMSPPPPDQENAASQHDTAGRGPAAPLHRRGHGGALPK